MMITAETLCGRFQKVDEKDVRIYPWGENIVCCPACRSVADARWSWMEVYA